jgi:hypothetical protein
MRLSDCLCASPGASEPPMSTPVQLAIVGALVAAALGYVLRATWKTWAGGSKAGCGSGCGKCAAPAAPEPPGRRSLPMA